MDNIGLLLGIGGIIITIIGIVVSINLTKESRPLYAMRSNVLQGVNHPDLEIRFRNSKVPNIFSVRFVLWNAGRKEIRKDDIPSPQAAPRLQFSGETVVLHYEATTTTGDHSGLLIPDTLNSLCISFDYLNKGDAIVGEILCTTNGYSNQRPCILGTFKGSTLKEGDVHNLRKVENIYFIFIAVIMFLIASWNATSAFLAFSANQIIIGIMWVLFALLSLWLTFIDLKFNVFSIPNKLPIKLKHYLDYGTIL